MKEVQEDLGTILTEITEYQMISGNFVTDVTGVLNTMKELADQIEKRKLAVRFHRCPSLLDNHLKHYVRRWEPRVI